VSPPSDLLAGRYRLTQQLRQSGFTTTYAADDIRLGRPVAIKIWEARFGQDEHFALRLVREAPVVAAVRHPTIVNIYDYGQGGSMPYLVMELVDGPDLGQILTECGPLRPTEAVRIMRDVLEGLQALHDAGIIHREIKPQNVLKASDGAAKLMPLGTAAYMAHVSLSDLTLETVEMALGPVGYMARSRRKEPTSRPAPTFTPLVCFSSRC
jgi:eukaryotic-like serine/threonine-protein kinase